MKDERTLKGFMLLKLDASVRYRGVDREPFEPQIIDSELDVDADSGATDIWAMYPPGWRHDAYRMFSANQESGPEDIVFLKSLDAAQAILRLVPSSAGQYEVIKCRFLSAPSAGIETSEQRGPVLGYDVAYPGGDYYSAVRNGLHVNPHSELFSKHAAHLNEHGLFPDPRHAVKFLDDFRNLVSSEAASSFIVYELMAVGEKEQ